MKKWASSLLCVLLGVIIGGAIIYFSVGSSRQTIVNIGPDSEPIGADASNASLTAYAYEVLGYIKEENFGALSAVVHPEFGLVFSPYATVALSTNKCFTAGEVAKLGEDSSKYIWGVKDGSGGPIEMTVSDYFSEFVYKFDYMNAPEIGVDYIVRTGNALENITEVFPDSRFVDFHIPKTTKNTEGQDWSSIRLVFEEHDGVLMLSAVVHSVWTV